MGSGLIISQFPGWVCCPTGFDESAGMIGLLRRDSEMNDLVSPLQPHLYAPTKRFIPIT